MNATWSGYRTLWGLCWLVIAVGIGNPDIGEARQRRTLAVLPLGGRNQPRTLPGQMEDYLHRTGAFRLIERRQLDQLLAEYELELSGLVETAAGLSRIGKLLGAEYLVLGEVDVVYTGENKDTRYTGSLRLVAVETGEIWATLSAERCQWMLRNAAYSFASTVTDRPIILPLEERLTRYGWYGGAGALLMLSAHTGYYQVESGDPDKHKQAKPVLYALGGALTAFSIGKVFLFPDVYNSTARFWVSEAGEFSPGPGRLPSVGLRASVRF